MTKNKGQRNKIVNQKKDFKINLEKSLVDDK